MVDFMIYFRHRTILRNCFIVRKQTTLELVSSMWNFAHLPQKSAAHLPWQSWLWKFVGLCVAAPGLLMAGRRAWSHWSHWAPGNRRTPASSNLRFGGFHSASYRHLRRQAGYGRQRTDPNIIQTLKENYMKGRRLQKIFVSLLWKMLYVLLVSAMVQITG